MTTPAHPRIFYLQAENLAQTSRALQLQNPQALTALASLRSQADQSLLVRPASVIDKISTAPSGNKHDYLTFAPYWWPNPDTPDGLPYIRRDGIVNPTARDHHTDRPALDTMIPNVNTLALAWHLTGHQPYAQHAATMLRVWFLNPDTYMTPHLDYAQGMPGGTEGRGIGIIETQTFATIIDAIGLLGSYSGWTTQDQAGMQVWMDAYLHWLQTSKLGQQEACMRNNHGTWYDTQIVSLALFTDQPELARQTLEAAKEKRLAAQIQPDGSQPRELARTCSLGYSFYNLRAFTTLAQLGQSAQVDLWHYQSPSGSSLRQAIDSVAPYADPTKSWPHQQIQPLLPSLQRHLPYILREAAIAYINPHYLQYLQHLPANTEALSRALLVNPVGG